MAAHSLLHQRIIPFASVQCLQAATALPANKPSGRKRPLFDSPTALSPTERPLAQRIRSDFQIGEGEVESPEIELLRCQLAPELELVFDQILYSKIQVLFKCPLSVLIFSE